MVGNLPLKLLFAGTSRFAVPALEALARSAHQVLAVITRADRPAGRGQRLRASPVRRSAAALGLPVRTPEPIHSVSELAALARLGADLMVVAAYGQILTREVLALPRLGCVNLHGSLLPSWRGAAPVAHALLAGDPVTGVTLMQMDAGLDTGPVLAQARAAVTAEDDRGGLTDRLAGVAARLLIDSLPRLAAGELPPLPQDEALVSYAPALKREEGQVNWSRPGQPLWRQIRAYTPRPGAFTFLASGRRLLLRRARVLAPHEDLPTGPPGSLGPPGKGGGIPVRCGGETGLMLLRVQPGGCREMEAAAAVRGGHLALGTALGGSGRIDGPESPC
ncbi:MAG: methionyl-tRNA formyltransferase [Acidobacteriota bacterium]